MNSVYVKPDFDLDLLMKKVSIHMTIYEIP